ncbi:arginine/serine-rich coiled-coil protein 2 isoform X1 [Oryzias latipes]|uniref:arginine/serine-rich coiled-coil protein 2 isoform X1 n=1 Tax=Oryzias latipes TaxID=8090 RepID=UPI0002A49BB1|nr:arginine/serine-rich coiled-coil protein 2 isoform X1 [Oryzias latipes]
MSGSDNDSVDMARSGSPVYHRKKHSMESSKSPRTSKHHHLKSKSRSRSRDRKRDRKHRRSHSRSKEARKRDSDKPSKSHRKTGEQQDQDRLGPAENGDERSRRKERRSSRGRSLSRSHSRERRHHSKSRDKRRSRSRSRDRKKKARSRSGSKTKHHRHSRSRSRSRERKKKIEKVIRKSRSRSVSPIIFRGRNTAMDAQEALARRLERAKKLQEQKEKEIFEKQQQQQEISTAAPVAATSNPALNVAALLASGTQVTPQIAMAAQMAALQAKTLAETGIAVPTYYNPSAVNPMKFAEQEKKRKMLWQGKKEGDKSQTAELWEKLNFGNKDQNVKFRKLMGIKGDDEAEASKPINEEGLKTLQKQEEMFRNLDVQYEMARSQTHTQRGMGLGFTSSFSRGMDSV